MSEPARKLPHGMTPRLLGREAAAAYLGISAGHFDKHVSIRPVEIGGRRLWDVRALDRWLDDRAGVAHAPRSDEEWLERLDDPARARHQ